MYLGTILKKDQCGAEIGEELQCNCEDRDAANMLYQWPIINHLP